MFDTDINNGSVLINYCSDGVRAAAYNDLALKVPESQKVYHHDWLGGYRYPILDWISSQLDGSHYQVLKMARPSSEAAWDQVEAVLRDSNTLYGYPDGSDITAVQFVNWDNASQSLEDLGIDITVSPKLFKRIKTFNRGFRAFWGTTDTVRVVLVGDDAFSRFYGDLDPKVVERLFDGAFIISPSIVDACMTTFDEGTKVFDDESLFSVETFNRNTEVGEYYKNSKVFNTRIFGPMEILNEGNYDINGAIKGQAFVDLGGLCEGWGADVIAPYSAFKPEVNISTASFFLIEPQNAKLGQMFSDGQTIVNLPALYQWRDVYSNMDKWFNNTYDQLVNNKILSQWSDMSFARFDAHHPKMFDATDVNAITMWNVRAWLTCGGKLSDSPWLFQQMVRNLYESMRVDDPRKLRFPVPCAARAQVIPESLLRGIRGLTDPCDDSIKVVSGTAHWDNDLHVLVVADIDWLEMYESHGGCDEDDFFQIYWRTMDGMRKIIICRSPNDWGEYSVFDYIEGDWYSKTTYGSETITFPEVSTDEALWPKRLSEALADEEIVYEGLPEHVFSTGVVEFNADYILAAIDDTAASASSVGINVNARQLYSDAMKSHRPEQLCSMESCIDAGVQGGSEGQVQAVIAEGTKIINYLIDNKIPVDLYLWRSKHEFFYPDVEVQTYKGNISYLQSVRYTHGKAFLERTTEYGSHIVENANYDVIHALGTTYIGGAVAMLRNNRRSIAQMNHSNNTIDPGVWDTMGDILTAQIESLEQGHERNSFMLSLYSACIKVPTSSGHITDQFVMQPALFKYLLEALQFYGVLCYLEINENGHLKRKRISEWKFYDSVAGKMQCFTNPIDYQAWYFATKAAQQEAQS